MERLVAVGSTQLIACFGGPDSGLYVVDGDPQTVWLDDLALAACDEEQVLVNESARVLVVRDGSIGGLQTGAGALYLEDVVTAGALSLTGQDVWARQLNPEPQGLHLSNDGGRLWVLGLKTERGGVLVDSRPGSATEILGGFVYTTTSPEGAPMFRVEDAEVSISIRETNFGGYYGDWAELVEERQAGETRTLFNTDAPQPAFGSALPLYVSRRADPPPPDPVDTADTGVPAPVDTGAPPEAPAEERPSAATSGCGCGGGPPGGAALALLVSAVFARRRR